MKRSLKATAIILAELIFVLWMVINTFIVDSFGLALVLVTLIIGAIQYFRIPSLHESRINDCVLNLFKIAEDEPDLRKHTIFHKGGAGVAPGNTMEAINKAIEFGVAGVEIDVSVTKDGVCVLFHGPRMDSTTDGTGLIHEHTFEELTSLNASVKDDLIDKYPVTRIPKLEDCVIECLKNNMVIFFDCKGDSAQTVLCLLDLYKKYPELYRLGVVCSFYPQTIYSLRQKDSNILTALTIRNHVLDDLGNGMPRNKEMWKRVVSPFLDYILSWMHVSFLWYFTGNSFVLLERGAISANFKSFWDKIGVRTIAWTVNCPLERQFLIKSLGIPVISDILTYETLQ